VRNPFFTGMLSVAAGATLAAPSRGGALALAALLAAVTAQVRVVEEPHLRRTFGEEYAAYARRVGRFLPGVGGTA
jgi:protein-S-isoprenylcysteine O-methyltransferase Ste14